MPIRTLCVLIFLWLSTGCTTTGAPGPNEQAALLQCELGEMMVCTGETGSRIKRVDHINCTCN